MCFAVLLSSFLPAGIELIPINLLSRIVDKSGSNCFPGSDRVGSLYTIHGGKIYTLKIDSMDLLISITDFFGSMYRNHVFNYLQRYNYWTLSVCCQYYKNNMVKTNKRLFNKLKSTYFSFANFVKALFSSRTSAKLIAKQSPTYVNIKILNLLKCIYLGTFDHCIRAD